MYKFYIAYTEEFELPVTKEELSLFVLGNHMSLSNVIAGHHQRLISKHQENRRLLEIQFSNWCMQVCLNCPGTILFTMAGGSPDIYTACIMGEYASLYFVPGLTNQEQ